VVNAADAPVMAQLPTATFKELLDGDAIRSPQNKMYEESQIYNRSGGSVYSVV